MFYYKNKNDKKKRILAGAVAVIIVLAMIASMVVSAFAEETQGQVQAKSYDLTFNKKNNRRVWNAASAMRELVSKERRMMRAVSEINEYANDRLTRYMQWDVLGYKYDYDGSSFSTTWTNPDVVSQLSNMTLEGNLVEQYKKQKDLDQSPIDLDLQFTSR